MDIDACAVNIVDETDNKQGEYNGELVGSSSRETGVVWRIKAEVNSKRFSW